MVFEKYSQLWYQRDPALKTSQTNSIPSATTPPNMPPNMMLPGKITVTTSTLPLFNFSQFLILTTQRSSAQLFVALRKNYAKALSKDPEFSLVLKQLLLSLASLLLQSPQPFFFAALVVPIDA